MPQNSHYAEPAPIIGETSRYSSKPYVMHAVIGVIIAVIAAVLYVGGFTVFVMVHAHVGREAMRELFVQPSVSAETAGLVSELKHRSDRVEHGLRFLRPLAYIPVIGNEYRAASAASASADLVVSSADHALAALRAGGESSDIAGLFADSRSAAAVIAAFRERSDVFSSLARHAEHLAAAERSESLFVRAQEAYEQIHRIGDYLAPALHIAAVLNEEHLDLLGFRGNRRYLVVFQNAHEIRPGGGIISMYGILNMEEGAVDNVSVAHVSTVRHEGESPHAAESPQPLHRFVDSRSLTFANANWAADPAEWTSLVYRLWHETQPHRPVDGLLAIGTPLLEDVVDILGPLTIPEVSEPVTGENVVELLDWVVIQAQEYGDDPETERIVWQHLVDEIRYHLERSGPDQLLRVMASVADRTAARDILAYAPEERYADALGVLSAAGRLPAPEGDEFFLLDANLGSAKADAKMNRTFSLEIDASDPDSASAQADITYDYSDAEPDARTWPYSGHVRILLPLTSEVYEMRGVQDVMTRDIEARRMAFGNYVFINFGETGIVSAKYNLARSVRSQLGSGEYALTLRKQGGVEQDYAVSLVLPEAWEQAEASATDGHVAVNRRDSDIVVLWDGELRRDATITIRRLR